MASSQKYSFMSKGPHMELEPVEV